MAGKDVAEMLGVSSAVVVYNWARAAEEKKTVAADRSPIAWLFVHIAYSTMRHEQQQVLKDNRAYQGLL